MTVEAHLCVSVQHHYHEPSYTYWAKTLDVQTLVPDLTLRVAKRFETSAGRYLWDDSRSTLICRFIFKLGVDSEKEAHELSEHLTQTWTTIGEDDY